MRRAEPPEASTDRSRRRSSIQVIAQIRDSWIPKHVKFLLLTLASRGDAVGKSIYPSTVLTATDIGVTPRAVRSMITELVTNKVLRLAKGSTRDGGRGLTANYEVNLKSAWLRPRVRHPKPGTWLPGYTGTKTRKLAAQNPEARRTETRKRAAINPDPGRTKPGSQLPPIFPVPTQKDLPGDLQCDLQGEISNSGDAATTIVRKHAPAVVAARACGPSQPDGNDVQELLALFFTNGSRLDNRNLGKAKYLLGTFPKDDLLRGARAYRDADDAYLVKNAHPFSIFAAQCDRWVHISKPQFSRLDGDGCEKAPPPTTNLKTMYASRAQRQKLAARLQHHAGECRHSPQCAADVECVWKLMEALAKGASVDDLLAAPTWTVAAQGVAAHVDTRGAITR